MQTTKSSDELTSAVEKLAERVVYNAEHRRRKQADLAETLKGLGGKAVDAFKASPAAGTGLLGAGLGGAYGLASSLGQPEEERRPFGSALSGALAGGALGAGAGLAGQGISNYLKNRPAAPPAASDTFTHNGKNYRLNPGAGKLLPELQQLESRSPVTRGVGAVTDSVLGYAKNHPLLASLMGADIGSHAIGTAAEMTTAGRGGGPTKGHFTRALESLKKEEGSSLTPETGKAMKRWAEGLSGPEFHEHYTKATRNGTPLQVLLGDGKGGPKLHTVDPEALKTVGHAGTGRVRPGGLRSALDVYESLSGRTFGNALTGTGYGGEAKAVSGKITPLLQRLLGKARGATTAKGVGGAVEGGLRRLGSIPRPVSALGRLGWRGALYGGIPAAQWYLGQSGAESAARKRVEQLLQTHATPVGN